MTMNKSAVEVCRCNHLYPAHDPEFGCTVRRGAGVCSCFVFDLAPDQIHLDTLAAVAKGINENGYSPSIRELGDLLGISSSATVKARLDVLEGAGLIERVGARAIKVTA